MYDLQSHLKRIQYQGDLKPTLQVLNDLHRLSSFHIPFENFDVHLKGLVSLDKEDIFNKIILNNRGGYCYELNGLFYDLLAHLGFKVQYIDEHKVIDVHTEQQTSEALQQYFNLTFSSEEIKVLFQKMNGVSS